MANDSKSRVPGRPVGPWQQQLLRIAASRQELAEVQAAVPKTRQRAIILLAVPTLQETLEVVCRLLKAGQVSEASDLARDALALLKGE